MDIFNTLFHFIHKINLIIATRMFGYCTLVLLLSTTGYSSGQPQMRICDSNKITDQIIDFKDTGAKQDCTCKITRNVSAVVSFLIKNFACDIHVQAWKLNLYVDGCISRSALCTNQWDTNSFFSIDESEPTNVFFLHLFKYHQQTTGIDYNVRLLTLGKNQGSNLEVECGLDANVVIPKKSPQQCLTTTTTSTSTHSPSSTISREKTTIPGSSNTYEDDKEKLSSGLIIGIVVGGVVFVVVVITLIVIGASRKPVTRKKLVEDVDSQSQYSYARELPGGKKNYKHHQKKLREADEKASNISKHTNISKSTHSVNDQSSHQNNQTLPNGHASFENPNIFYDKGSKTLPNVYYENGETWWVEAPKKENENSSINTMSTADIYSKPSKKSKKKQDDSSLHTSHIQPVGDEPSPYTYYNRIVDDQFSFIHNDLYSGHV